MPSLLQGTRDCYRQPFQGSGDVASAAGPRLQRERSAELMSWVRGSWGTQGSKGRTASACGGRGHTLFSLGAGRSTFMLHLLTLVPACSQKETELVQQKIKESEQLLSKASPDVFWSLSGMFLSLFSLCQVTRCAEKLLSGWAQCALVLERACMK